MKLRFYPKRYSDNYNLTISNFNTTIEHSFTSNWIERGAVVVDLSLLDLINKEVYYISVSDSKGIVWRGKMGNNKVKIENDNIIRV